MKAVGEMSIEELDAALSQLTRSRDAAQQQQLPSESTALIEAEMARVTNELRRRGL